MRRGKISWTATLYICDPEKNEECRKFGCAYLLGPEEGGTCYCTFERSYAREYSDGTPMIYERGKRGKKDV